MLGTDAETIRQAALDFDGSEARIPLFLQVSSTLKVASAPVIDADSKVVRQLVFRGIGSNGPVELWDETGVPEKLSDGQAIPPGFWLEIEPTDGHDIAAMPTATHRVSLFLSPAYHVGGIPPRALVIAYEGAPLVNFADCWIQAADVERLQAPAPTLTKAAELRPQRERTLLAVIRSLLKDRGGDRQQVYKLAAQLAAILSSEGTEISDSAIAKALKDALR